MDKKTIKLLMALLLVSVFLVSLCVENKEGLGMVTTTENVETPPTTAETIASTAQPTGIPLNDIQKEACASADDLRDKAARPGLRIPGRLLQIPQ
jgi:hypothetical protein